MGITGNLAARHAISKAWEELFPDRQAIADGAPRQLAVLANPDDAGHSCVMWDEELEQQQEAPVEPVTLLDDGDGPQAGDSRSQGDQGPYHWAQGPQDVRTVQAPPPPPPPPPPPVPIKPKPTPVLPRRGYVITSANLRVRIMPGITGNVRGVLPVHSVVMLTGGVRLPQGGGRWVRIQYRKAALGKTEGSLQPPDKWIDGTGVGWVNSAFLAMPASEYTAADADLPPVTHEWPFEVADAMDVDKAALTETLAAIFADPRGPRRAGLLVRPVRAGEQPLTIVRFVQSSCGGAAGCYYKQSGQVARVDLNREYWGTQWLSRIAIHELAGHAATRCFDHYRGAPDWPRDDYYGIMGNWQDAFGDHAWPDQDDIDNWVLWLQGASPVVKPRR
jgi:hypothetical protein